MILTMEMKDVITISLTILTSLLIPVALHFRKKMIKKKQEKIKDKKTLCDTVDAVQAINETLLLTNQLLTECKDHNVKLSEEFEKYQILSIKYMINDAFFGYNSVHEIPYETLLIAMEGCDIYCGKGYNHEIGARCEIIREEFSRRQKNKGEGIHNE